jgi:transmembrane sensor
MASVDKYENYSAIELATEAAFIEWVKCPDAARDLFWKEYVERYPLQTTVVAKARTLVSEMRLVNETMQEGRAAIVWDKITEGIHSLPVGARVRPLYSRWWAAAAVLVFVVFGLWFLVGRDKVEQPSVAATPKVQDIAPGGDKAVLVLADGRKVVLDTAGNGTITKQGGVTVLKLNDGQLAYNESSNVSPSGGDLEGAYNTITTPKGGQYQLVLADGTKVWLNAASSLRFPTAFTAKDRRVELSGEGYFEVTHNQEKPFHVQVNTPSGEGGDVQVLGTHFNINAYNDEGAVKTTLLEGSVKMSSSGQTALLRPGQQAQLQTTNHKLQTINHVDLDEVMAWKNGVFHFADADLVTVMRQLARWYDVEIEYKGAIPKRRFEGEMQRSLMLSQVLKILEKNNVHFKIIGKKILVMP